MAINKGTPEELTDGDPEFKGTFVEKYKCGIAACTTRSTRMKNTRAPTTPTVPNAGSKTGSSVSATREFGIHL